MRYLKIASVLMLTLLTSYYAKARVITIEEYDYKIRKTPENVTRCEDLTGYYTTQPQGYSCTLKTYKGLSCYTGCVLTCTDEAYPYTSDNCSALSGETCTINDTPRYKQCNCSYTNTAANCSNPTGSNCSMNGTTYYQNCNCSYTNTASNCSGTLGGNTCKKNNVTYYQTCTTCNYTYTLINCSGTLGGGSCTKNGITYYQTCTNCNYTNTTDNCSNPTGSTCTKNRTTYYQNCDCSYTYTSDNCSGTLGGGSCKKDNVTYRQSCTTCNYTYTSNNCNGTLSGAYCTKNGTTYYQTCTPNQTGGSCSAGDIVYRLNFSNTYGDETWYQNKWSGYPDFACLSPSDAAAAGNKTCIKTSNGQFYYTTCDNNITTYERTGIMLNNHIAVDTSENWEIYGSGYANEPDNLFVSCWLDRNRGDYETYASSCTPFSGTYNGIGTCTPSPSDPLDDCGWRVIDQELNLPQYNNVRRSDYITGGGNNSSGVTNLVNALAATSTNTDVPLGPKSTYSYTFGIPYLIDANNMAYQDSTYSSENGNIFSFGLVMTDSGNPMANYYGYITPAWYCMNKNLEHTTYTFSTRSGHTVTGGTLSKQFTVNNNKVYYYLPTIGDWKIFADAVSGDSSLKSTVFGAYTGFGAWSSTYEPNTSGGSLNIWNYDGSTNSIYGHTESLMYIPSPSYTRVATYINSTPEHTPTILPTVTKCFIYISGYTPDDDCGITLSGPTEGRNTITISGSGCTYQ